MREVVGAARNCTKIKQLKFWIFHLAVIVCTSFENTCLQNRAGM
jgi:hypothetical protein